MSDPEPSPWKSASVSLATHGQTKEKVLALVSSLLVHGQCLTCGRLVRFDVTFAVDPPPELAQLGVTAIATT